jgi:retinal rod rhodopsin-sensitive cGMP 3',5'-cyclic phosphodiesterase subunit delta
VEEYSYYFGFVIPGSTNNWQQTIITSGEGNMIPAEVLSG